MPNSLEEAVIEHGSKRAAAKELNIPFTTFLRRLTKERAANYKIPLGLKLAGTSTLYDTKGEKVLEWVKTSAESERIEEFISAFVDGLKSEIVSIAATRGPAHTIEDLASCYVLTDFHLGQLSWGEETGEDWDMDIAVDLLTKWFGAAIESAPDSKVGILAQLGDFLHWDGILAVTPTSGHILDADTRFSKLVSVAIKAIRVIIQIMLQKHERVHVIMAEGNHDISSSIWLRALLAELYQNEPRITIDNTKTPFYCYEWGQTSLFFHHGHKRKVKDISYVFAGLYREVFGRTKYSYAHMGHLHHIDVKENQMMIVEQHPTLAAKDAHSARGGYLSQRGASVITYSKKAGEVSRSIIRPEFLND